MKTEEQKTGEAWERGYPDPQTEVINLVNLSIHPDYCTHKYSSCTCNKYSSDTGEIVVGHLEV